MHNPASVLENEKRKLQWDFDIKTDHLIPTRRPDLIIINNKKEKEKRANLQNCGFCCSSWPPSKFEKRINISTLHGNQRLWKINMTFIPIVIGVRGTLTGGLKKALEDFKIRRWVETIQITILLKSARILRRVLETWGDLLSLKFQWKAIS